MAGSRQSALWCRRQARRESAGLAPAFKSSSAPLREHRRSIYHFLPAPFPLFPLAFLPVARTFGLEGLFLPPKAVPVGAETEAPEMGPFLALPSNHLCPQCLPDPNSAPAPGQPTGRLACSLTNSSFRDGVRRRRKTKEDTHVEREAAPGWRNIRQTGLCWNTSAYEPGTPDNGVSGTSLPVVGFKSVFGASGRVHAHRSVSRALGIMLGPPGQLARGTSRSFGRATACRTEAWTKKPRVPSQGGLPCRSDLNPLNSGNSTGSSRGYRKDVLDE